MGGLPGARLLRYLGMASSADTVLRRVKVRAQKQRAEIPLRRRGHPDRRESILDEQLQQEVGIAAVVFLSPRFCLPDGCRMPHPARDRQLL